MYMYIGSEHSLNSSLVTEIQIDVCSRQMYNTFDIETGRLLGNRTECRTDTNKHFQMSRTTLLKKKNK